LDRFDACFEDLEHPRSSNAALHDFHAVLIIALCAALCGGQALSVGHCSPVPKSHAFGIPWPDERSAQPRHPSRLSRRLDPDQFRTAFQRFMTAFAETCQGVVAIDGKVLRRSFDLASGKSALHMVSAWAGADRNRRQVECDHCRAEVAENGVTQRHHRHGGQLAMGGCS
jgi:hypothetical protein